MSCANRSVPLAVGNIRRKGLREQRDLLQLWHLLQPIAKESRMLFGVRSLAQKLQPEPAQIAESHQRVLEIEDDMSEIKGGQMRRLLVEKCARQTERHDPRKVAERKRFEIERRPSPGPSV
jgi:hypothetical protein